MRISRVVSVICVLVVAACGSKSPAAPDSGTPGPSGATITIANGAVSPKSVTITSGQSVTFVNNDGKTHVIDSDPHPQHTDCPAINAVGTITNGQTKLTNAL